MLCHGSHPGVFTSGSGRPILSTLALAWGLVTAWVRAHLRLTAGDWAFLLTDLIVSAGIAALLSNIFGSVPYTPDPDDDPYLGGDESSTDDHDDNEHKR